MTLVFIGQDNLPAYMALSSDVSANAIDGAVLIGKTVLLTDTQEWKVILEDLTLAAYAFPAGGGGGAASADTLTTAEMTTTKVLKPNGTGGVAWGTVASGATAFTGLTDVPASYSGQANKIVSVNSGASALEFSSLTPAMIDPTGIYHSLTTPNVLDDEFDDDAITGWTAVNAHAGTLAWTENNHALQAVFKNMLINTTGSQLKAGTLADGEAWETRFSIIGIPSTYPSLGIVVTDGVLTTSKAFVTWWYMNNGLINIGMQHGTLNALNTADYQVAVGGFANMPLRMKMFRTNSTNFGMKFSVNGGTWLQTPTAGTTYNPTFTPTHAGLWVSNWNGAENQLVAFDYFRKVAA